MPLSSWFIFFPSFCGFSLTWCKQALTVDHYYPADQYCFTEKRLGCLSWKTVLNIYSKSAFMSEICWFYCWFLSKETLVWRLNLHRCNHSSSRSIMKTFLTELGVIVLISLFFCKAQDQDSANYCISICCLDLSVSFFYWKTRMYVFIYTVRCSMKVRENKG